MQATRLAFELTSLGYGGSTTYVRELLLRMGPDRFAGTIDLFLAEHNRDYLGELPTNIRKHVTGKGLTNYARRAWVQYHTLPQLARKLGIEVVFSAVGPTALAGRRAIGGFKLVTALHNMLPFDPEQRKLYGPFSARTMRYHLLHHALLRTYRNADRHIFISEYSRDRVLPLVPELKDRHVVIPNGIPSQFLDRIAHSKGRGAEIAGVEGPYALYVSILSPYKNHIPLLRGYAEARKHGFAMPLVLAGPLPEPFASGVRSEAKSLGIEQDVKFLGAVPGELVPELVKGASMLIFGSTCETSPFILLEYLAAGAPIISSDAPPMPEFGGEACRYVNALSPEAWRDALIEISADSRKAEALGKAALERTRLYSMDACAAKTLEALSIW